MPLVITSRRHGEVSVLRREAQRAAPGAVELVHVGTTSSLGMGGAPTVLLGFWPCLSHNCWFLWDHIFYKWAFASTLITGLSKGQFTVVTRVSSLINVLMAHIPRNRSTSKISLKVVEVGTRTARLFQSSLALISGNPVVQEIGISVNFESD